MSEKDCFEESGELLDDVVKYLTTKAYSENADSNKKRSIRRKAKKFEVRHGEMFYKNKVS